MKVLTSLKTVCLLMLLLTFPLQASAGQQRRGIAGDWEFTMDFNGQKVTSILSFSQDKEGKLTGKWIGFWGVNELNNLKYEENKLSFTQVSRFGNNEITSNFAGAIQRGKLSGTLSNDRGQFEVEGKRLRRMPMVMGSWEMKFKAGERDITTMLVVKADEAGKPAAQWQSQWGEHQITDVTFKKGNLTFQRKSKIQDQQWESTFEGTLKAHKLSGVIKSERGDITVEGTRVGAALVGQWDLDITTDNGTRKQLLRINPDLSAMLGPIAVKKVALDDNKVTFKTELNHNGFIPFFQIPSPHEGICSTMSQMTDSTYSRFVRVLIQYVRFIRCCLCKIVVGTHDGCFFFVTCKTKSGLMIGCSQEGIGDVCFDIFVASFVWIERVPLVGVVAAGTIDCTLRVSPPF